MLGEGIRELIQPNTKVLFTESPGSLTMEVQDIPTLSRIAHEHDIVVMLDNTWAAGYCSHPSNMASIFPFKPRPNTLSVILM